MWCQTCLLYTSVGESRYKSGLIGTAQDRSGHLAQTDGNDTIFAPQAGEQSEENISEATPEAEETPRKDFYRRNRDLSIFCFIGVYILSVIDAYVDAELSDFDISKEDVYKRQSLICTFIFPILSILSGFNPIIF